VHNRLPLVRTVPLSCDECSSATAGATRSGTPFVTGRSGNRFEQTHHSGQAPHQNPPGRAYTFLQGTWSPEETLRGKKSVTKNNQARKKAGVYKNTSWPLTSRSWGCGDTKKMESKSRGGRKSGNKKSQAFSRL